MRGETEISARYGLIRIYDDDDTYEYQLTAWIDPNDNSFVQSAICKR